LSSIKSIVGWFLAFEACLVSFKFQLQVRHKKKLPEKLFFVSLLG
jgi:hypothetical protein